MPPGQVRERMRMRTLRTFPSKYMITPTHPIIASPKRNPSSTPPKKYDQDWGRVMSPSNPSIHWSTHKVFRGVIRAQFALFYRTHCHADKVIGGGCLAPKNKLHMCMSLYVNQDFTHICGPTKPTRTYNNIRADKKRSFTDYSSDDGVNGWDGSFGDLGVILGLRGGGDL